MSGSLRLSRVSYAHGARQLLTGVDLRVGPSDRVGIVGPNGVGKTTLLRLAAGEITPESGSVRREPAAATVVLVTQEPKVEARESLADYLSRRTGVGTAKRRLDRATESLSTGSDARTDDEYAAALEAWLAAGGADFEDRAEAVCAELGLTVDLLDRGAAELSGGESARLRLATAYLIRADILLLDEPTNDLDMPGLARLERIVTGFAGGVVLVSHDREFCARVLDRVVEIDEFSHAVTEYAGGWQTYLDERAWAREHAEQEYAGYAEKKAHLVERARRQAEWARAGAGRASNTHRENDKHIRFAKLQRAERGAGKASRLRDAAERLAEVEEPREPWELRLELAAADRSSEIVFTLREAVIERGSVRLGPVTLTVSAGERIRIIGPNGSGKSTLIDALLGRLALGSGSAGIGPAVVIGELSQSRDVLRGSEALLDVFRRLSGLDPEAARTLLAKFRVDADVVLRPADSLSPGERTRVGLALLQSRGTNCLILDEPTNHLDLPAIEQLESALTSYDGTVLLVTHDRRFADNVRTTREISVTSL